MTKIQFKDLPDRTTPRNATNLNKLNNVSIGTSTPTLNEELWVEYNGNLINYGSLNTLNAFINTTTGAISDSQSNQKTIYVAIKPNTKYYVRKTLGARFGIATYTAIPTYGSSCTSFVSNNSAQTLNITSGANDKYLAVWLYNSSVDTASFDSIVQSTIITTYETTESNVIKTEINANKNGYGKLSDTVNVGVDSNNAGLWVQHSKNYCNNIAKSYDIRGNGTYRYGVDLGYLEAGTYYLSRKDSSKTTVVYITEIDGTTYTDNAKSGTEFSFTLSKRVRCIARTTDNNASTWNNGVGKIMVERNNVKTTYEDYVQPGIKVNNNGIYEPIAYKNVYNFEEVVIGEYFSKPLYRKVITGKMGTCTTDGTYGTANNIVVSSNIDNVVNLSATMKIGSQVYTLMYMNNSGRVAKILYDGSNGVQLTTNGTSFSQKDCTVIVEYTKTTDTGISTLSLD